MKNNKMEMKENVKEKLSEHLTLSSAATLSHSSELDGLRLTPHFTLAELTKTNTNLKNVPNEVQIKNLKRLCGWLEKLRSRYNERYEGPVDVFTPLAHRATLALWRGAGGEAGVGGDDPLVINSGYRSEEVNKAVGGVATSNHLTGCAADIRVSGMEQALRYAVILLDISDESREDFDELLIERNARGAIWLHFAVRESGNRRKLRFIS